MARSASWVYPRGLIDPPGEVELPISPLRLYEKRVGSRRAAGHQLSAWVTGEDRKLIHRLAMTKYWNVNPDWHDAKTHQPARQWGQTPIFAVTPEGCPDSRGSSLTIL